MTYSTIIAFLLGVITRAILTILFTLHKDRKDKARELNPTAWDEQQW